MDVILDATARVLTEQGLDQLTTNAVAELAGVSVGSIYQYFPGKEALFAELRRRHQREVNEAISDALNSSTDLDFEDSLRLLIRANVEVHAKAPRLHYLLTKQYRDVRFEANADEQRVSLVVSEYSPIERYLQNSAGVPQARAKTMARVCVEIVESLTHASVIHEKLHLSNDELVEEIVCVVLGYLSRAGVPNL